MNDLRNRLILPSALYSSMLILGIILLFSGQLFVVDFLWAGGVISAIIMAVFLLKRDIATIARKSYIGRNGVWFGATAFVLTIIWIIISIIADSSTLKWMLYAGVSMCSVSLVTAWISAKPGEWSEHFNLPR